MTTKSETHSLLKKLGIALPGENEIAQLNALQARWRAFQARANDASPRHVPERKEAAFKAFAEDPTAENERQLMILADTDLTLKRMSVLREGLKEVCRRITGEAADVIAPYFDSSLATLEQELQIRKEQKTTFYPSSDPRVKECQKAYDFVSWRWGQFATARSRKCDDPPLEVCEVFLPDAEEPEAGE